MSNLHKSKRRVLKIVNSTICNTPVKLVYWCIVQRENSRSIYSTHIAVTAYCGVKNQGVTARFPVKPERIEKKTMNVQIHSRDLSEAATHAWLNSIQSKGRLGTVKWFSRSVGYVTDDATQQLFTIYACNVKGADNMHHELVTNIELNSGDRVKFDLGDSYQTMQCGACSVEIIEKKVG